jgi:hypothetical protein
VDLEVVDGAVRVDGDLGAGEFLAAEDLEVDEVTGAEGEAFLPWGEWGGRFWLGEGGEGFFGVWRDGGELVWWRELGVGGGRGIWSWSWGDWREVAVDGRRWGDGVEVWGLILRDGERGGEEREGECEAEFGEVREFLEDGGDAVEESGGEVDAGVFESFDDGGDVFAEEFAALGDPEESGEGFCEEEGVEVGGWG